MKKSRRLNNVLLGAVFLACGGYLGYTSCKGLPKYISAYRQGKDTTEITYKLWGAECEITANTKGGLVSSVISLGLTPVLGYCGVLGLYRSMKPKEESKEE